MVRVGGVFVIAVALTIGGTACGSATRRMPADPAGGGSPSASSHANIDTDALDRGVGTLRAYLDTWRRDGAATASARYLTGDEVVDPKGWAPVLTSWRLRSWSTYEWRTAGDFTLVVDLEVHFRGDPGTWGDGTTTRFVHLTRAPNGEFRLYLTTSP